MANLSLPFLKTDLTANIALHPSQLNNEIYNNILNNLKKLLVGKCYKNYGYISKIYDIIDVSDGQMYQEDINASVIYKVHFKCMIVNPIKNTIILCKVIQNTQDWLLVGNAPEPINIIISHDRINESVFSIDAATGNIRTSSHILEENEFVKVRITAVEIVDKDSEVLSIGYLEGIPTDDEIKYLYDNIYD